MRESRSRWRLLNAREFVAETARRNAKQVRVCTGAEFIVEISRERSTFVSRCVSSRIPPYSDIARRRDRPYPPCQLAPRIFEY